MTKYFLDNLFLNNKDFNEEILSESFLATINGKSYLRLEYRQFLDLVKKYNNYELINERLLHVGEDYLEYNFIVKLDTDEYFYRIIYQENNKISDILVYNLISNELKIYYENIFLQKEIELLTIEEKELIDNKMMVAYLKENNHFKLIYHTTKFLNLVGYEDWDYLNKHQNYLDAILLKDDFTILLNPINDCTITLNGQKGIINLKVKITQSINNKNIFFIEVL